MLRLGNAIEVSNAPVEGLRLQPEAGGQVRGKFRLDTGQKLDWTQLTVALIPAEEHGAEVAWEGGMDIPTISSVNTDGTFELKNVPGGNYQLMVGAKSDDLRDYFTTSINLEGRDVADYGLPVRPEPSREAVISGNEATTAGNAVDVNRQQRA